MGYRCVVILPFSLRLGELFSGPGGMGFGASQASLMVGDQQVGFKHAWANDIEADACRTYLRNIPEADRDTVYNEDVRTLAIEKLSAIDCLAFGFPCNDFSVVGEQKGFDGNFGPLYSYGVKVLERFAPICFVAENVGGLASANEGSAFAKILEDLRTAGPGYILHQQIYKAEEYGVPQKRRRILIVGIRKDLDRTFTPPSPTTKDKPPTVRDALITQPVPADAFNNELTRQSDQVVARLKHIRAGENAFNATLPAGLELNVKGARISQIYRRLHPDQPAYTVTGSGGGGTHVYHWEENRALTNRERARLQGFPDDYEFIGTKESVRKQIGMAVPPPLARAIFTALLESLHGIAEHRTDIIQHALVMETKGNYA
jgi:DNA (cytosine-5)-methyltransferase 1